MKILKILNNNALISTDTDGIERIIMGCGLAFQKHVGEDVDDDKIEKIFVLKDNDIKNQFQQLVTTFPVENIYLAEKIISYAKSVYSKRLDDGIYITLTDHLNASIERAKKM